LHITQFYEWDTIIGKGLDKSSSDHMKIVLSPKKLFELFCKFKDGLLNEYSKVNLQNKMKAQDCPIAIEIITYAPFDPEQSDVKQILLYAKNISTEERNCKKIQQRDSQVDNLLSVIKQMSVEMQDIKFRMKRAEKTADFAAQKIKDLETRNIYTKEEVNNLVTNFNDAIRITTRMNEIDTKIGNYQTSFNDLVEKLNAKQLYSKEEIDSLLAQCVKNA
jgi:DNA repair ATPase RecN